ncbi:hypothetical protein IGI04_030134 [Brassica rapa subsp. trilocularis]|uniref:Uncharacterized protein n=1 Tax=Brassica rapa subsp. trilocularis TaxID=1813537 RepID=A0ABQ7LPU0_BRACM|nr:hypothetical protein IGI04_030134 [Brassica rapa subsp. trilocularis]
MVVLVPSSSVASQRSTRRRRFKPLHRDQTSMASISPSPRRGHALAPPSQLRSPLCSAPVRLVEGIKLAVGIKLRRRLSNGGFFIICKSGPQSSASLQFDPKVS